MSEITPIITPATVVTATPTKGYHFFWKEDSPFSQWHESTYTLDGYEYKTAEQGMMHGKALLFGDEAIAAKILQTGSSSNSRKMKALGRKVRGFSDSVWEEHRMDIVYRNSMAKFTQNEELCLALLETSPKLLVEASPFDKIWGIGLAKAEAKKMRENQWKGMNLLGKILTKVREDIIAAKQQQEQNDQAVAGENNYAYQR